MQTEWEVGRPSGVCTACGRSFQVNERYYAALVDQGATFQRQEFCEACWSQSPRTAFSFWLTRVPEPNAERKLFVDDDVIVNFFERLHDATEPLKINFRFIVALILMRKRLLKFDTTEREGDGEYWVLRMPRDKSRHRVLNPRLTDEEVQHLSEEVGALLNVET
jgi:hypothetical protein